MRARTDAQHHVAAWRTGYEGSPEVSVSLLLSSHELGFGTALRSRYTAALAAEARRLHAQLVVRAAAAAEWVHRADAAPFDATREPARSFLASQWRIVASEIGAEIDNELLRGAFEQLARVAVARELVHVAFAGQVAPLSDSELEF